MKNRYKITIVVLLLVAFLLLPISMIDYVYAYTDNFEPIIKVFCPVWTISDDFVEDQIFFAVYVSDPIDQLNRIKYSIDSICHIEDPNHVSHHVDLEYDYANSKGCPQFCPKEIIPMKAIFDPDLTHVVFHNRDRIWLVYPGGAGPIPPANSTLFKIYKEVEWGISPLDLEAMLNDKIFVDKCQLYDGVWNYIFSYCQLYEGVICEDIGGIPVMIDITPECTGICFDRGVYSINSCVFEYNGE